MCATVESTRAATKRCKAVEQRHSTETGALVDSMPQPLQDSSRKSAVRTHWKERFLDGDAFYCKSPVIHCSLVPPD